MLKPPARFGNTTCRRPIRHLLLMPLLAAGVLAPLHVGAESTATSFKISIKCGVADQQPLPSTPQIPDCGLLRGDKKGWLAGELVWLSGGTEAFRENGPFFVHATRGLVEVFLDGNDDPARAREMYEDPATTILTLPDLRFQLWVDRAGAEGDGNRGRNGDERVLAAEDVYRPVASALWAKHSEDSAANAAAISMNAAEIAALRAFDASCPPGQFATRVDLHGTITCAPVPVPQLRIAKIAAEAGSCTPTPTPCQTSPCVPGPCLATCTPGTTLGSTCVATCNKICSSTCNTQASCTATSTASCPLVPGGSGGQAQLVACLAGNEAGNACVSTDTAQVGGSCQTTYSTLCRRTCVRTPTGGVFCGNSFCDPSTSQQTCTANTETATATVAAAAARCAWNQ